MNELKTKRAWLCWKYETNKNGETTKVPYSTLNRRIGVVQIVIS
jgi:primase-polymerase (primpol)-like protein